jgi:hypothetical protein
MNTWSSRYRALSANPRYTLMRGFGRFGVVRALVKNWRKFAHRRALKLFLAQCESDMHRTVFPDIDRDKFLHDLEAKGASFGLRLPPDLLSEIMTFVKDVPCFADRESDKGFYLDNRAAAEKLLGKPILVAQYFNVATTCPAAEKILNDPFLGSMPVFVGANLWWTFPVVASEEDRDRHAHRYHRDLDDFRFLKFFFYLTDVGEDDGAHILVLASHSKSPVYRFGDTWKIRRYSDSEINQMYEKSEIVEICSPAGAGFAENTLCVHKGLTPKRQPRLLLQFQFALFDYGVADDNRSQALLKVIA